MTDGFLRKNENSFLKGNKIIFLNVTLEFLAHIIIPCLVLITFRLILALSSSFGETQKSKTADPRGSAFGNHNVISCEVMEVGGGGGNPTPLHGPKIQKQLRIDRVKTNC